MFDKDPLNFIIYFLRKGSIQSPIKLQHGPQEVLLYLQPDWGFYQALREGQKGRYTPGPTLRGPKFWRPPPPPLRTCNLPPLYSVDHIRHSLILLVLQPDVINWHIMYRGHEGRNNMEGVLLSSGYCNDRVFGDRSNRHLVKPYLYMVLYGQKCENYI